MSALVDCNLARAAMLAERYAVPQVAEETLQLDPRPDAVLLALPHHLHAPVSLELLRQGIHVLVEKPMALSLADCDAMIGTAQTNHAWLAVGLARRFMPEVRLAKALIDAGVLGPIESFEARDGRVFNWQITTDFLFRRELSGGGVLFDLGIHTLDTLLFCLGELELREYADDSYGGVEAEAKLTLVLASGAQGTVELSRTRNLGCTFRIRGAEATLVVDLSKEEVRLDLDTAVITLETNQQAETDGNIFQAQLADWVEAIRTGRPPAVPGTQGRRSVALAERCYARRKPLDFPWVTPSPRPRRGSRGAGASSLRGKRVLVTGGTGFFGGRLVEKLVLEHGATVRVLVRDFSRVSRIARLNPEMMLGDVTDAQVVRRAAQGCEVVFHLASGNRGSFAQKRAVNVEGTENVAQAVLHAGVSRMVHVSTISISAKTPEGDVDETCVPLDPEPFSETKLQAERRVLELHRQHGLPVVVLRPSCIYGPYDHGFTISTITELRSRRILLVDGGNGLCNLVYVDDAVDALLLAAQVPSAVGEVFLISGEAPVPWKQYFGAYERMLGTSSTISMTVEEIQAYNRQEEETGRRSAEMLQRLESAGFVGSPQARTLPFRILSEHLLDFYRARPHFRIEKAKEILGFQPRFDFAAGMRLTEQWARWAGLIPDSG